MYKKLLTFTVSCMFCSPVFSQDIEGSQDHPIAGRYDGSEIVAYEAVEFDEQDFLTESGWNEHSTTTLEGEITRIAYRMPDGATTLQVLRGFEERLSDAGFEVLFTCVGIRGDEGCGPQIEPKGAWIPLSGFNFTRDTTRVLFASRNTETQEVNIQITVGETHNGPVFGSIVISEQAQFENRVIDAEGVSSELTAQGKMAFYDILFETGSADLKSSSDATLRVISEVISESEGLNVIVVGHTDNQGALDFNIELSRARAEAVRNRLVSAFAVPEDRISAAGVAFLAPVSTNTTAEGRTLNRRVEIVVR